MSMRSAALLSSLFLAAAATEPDSTPSTPSWLDSFKCTADLESDQPSIIDQSNCTTRTDANNSGCLWCDLSALIGPSQGVCVSSGVKDFIGEYWESICVAQASESQPDTPANPIPIPIIPIPAATSPPTKAPVAPPPAVNPPPVVPPPDNTDNGSFAGAFSCATDATSQMINDESTCTAKQDVTSEGKNCVWCPVPLVGGGCITNSDASSISWLCKSFETLMQSSTYAAVTNNLRGSGWEILDTTCLGDTSGDLDTEKSNCGGRNDKSGNSCVWCEGGGVLGYCVSSSQKDVLGNYLTCEDVAAPEVSTTGWEALDSSCFGDFNNGDAAEKEGCGGRNDKAGSSCVWCREDSGLGYCVSSAQKDVLGMIVDGYLTCDDGDEGLTAVE